MASISKLCVVKPHPDAIAALRHRASGGARLAPGFTANMGLNLAYHGGRTLADLRFANFYLGQWASADTSSIDSALSAALTDSNLNHVIQQYFQDPVTAEFLGSTLRGDASIAPGTVFDRDSVHATLASLDLSGYDLSKTVICLYLPQGVILDTRTADPSGVGIDTGENGIHKGTLPAQGDADDSTQGLGGYHGSAQIGADTVLFAIAVYSDASNGTINGIPFWPDSWKNIVATMYHELNEIRTDPDVEASMRDNNNAELGWYSDQSGEIGDIPMSEAGQDLGKVMVEVSLVAGGTAPVQLMWSNAVGGPGLPF